MDFNKDALERIDNGEFGTLFNKQFLIGMKKMAIQTNATHAEIKYSFVDDDHVVSGEWVPEVILRIKRV